MQSGITVLPSGVSMKYLGKSAYDWDSIRHLAEKGVAYADIAKHFKGLNVAQINERSKLEQWVTPHRSKAMRKAIETEQRSALARTGSARPALEVMEEIWKDRQSEIDEEAYRIASSAFKGVSEEVSADMIKDSRDLKTMVEVVRKVSGHDKREAEDLGSGPSLAVNVGFLRSTGPEAIEFIDV